MACSSASPRARGSPFWRPWRGPDWRRQRCGEPPAGAGVAGRPPSSSACIWSCPRCTPCGTARRAGGRTRVSPSSAWAGCCGSPTGSPRRTAGSLRRSLPHGRHPDGEHTGLRCPARPSHPACREHGCAVTDLVPGETEPDELSPPEGVPRPAVPAHPARAVFLLGALGVVYGDIGTSPLYAVQSVFAVGGGALAPTAGTVFGVVSLIFWSITLVVSVKYVTVVLRADNNGEGGVMALAALARRGLTRASARRAALVMSLGALGAALFYGDSVITPSISVLSAVEGLGVVAPDLAGAVVPIATVVLAGLFAVRRAGTERVGRVFGPVMLLWFTVPGAAGLNQVIRRPGILGGLSPSYALAFVAERPATAFVAMGAVVLAVTGAEALYSDLGHLGRPPIRRAWFLVVFPALTLNYLAQGALVLRTPSARVNPFFLLLPDWAQVPMVVLAALATVIASQAVISGAFSVSLQAARLGFLPRLRIRHTSARQPGQVYVATVNWLLWAGVLAVMFGFRSSSRLATAYGVAVTGTFLITTVLFLTVARASWRWSAVRLVTAGVVFGGLELIFLGVNTTKLRDGGWLTLLIAAVVYSVMLTWRRGRDLLLARRVQMEGTLPEFLEGVRRAP